MYIFIYIYIYVYIYIFIPIDGKTPGGWTYLFENSEPIVRAESMAMLSDIMALNAGGSSSLDLGVERRTIELHCWAFIGVRRN